MFFAMWVAVGGSAFAATGQTSDTNGVSYRVDHGTELTVDRPSVANPGGECWIVDNDHGQDIYVPTETPAEWSAFINNAPIEVGGVAQAGAVSNLRLKSCNCELDGVTVAEGDSYNFHLSTRPCGDACADIDQLRTCTGGNLDGDSNYNTASCPAMEACLDCDQDGVTVAHGGSRVFYDAEVEPCGSSCTGQSRNCFDGTLDGSASYQYANCTIEMCPFIVEMDPTAGTDGSTSTQVIIPAGSGTFNYEIRWRQGAGPTTTVSGLTGSYTINLPSTANVRVEIRGTFPHWRTASTTDRSGITDVIQWGEIAWGSMQGMFDGETGITTFSAADTPDLTGVTNISRIFAGATNFNSPIDSWDVSNVTALSAAFAGASSFNQPLNSWDVSNVRSFYYMFYQAAAFNQSLNSWNVTGVTSSVDFRDMFRYASNFNGDITSWNMSNAQNMYGMFWGSSFNRDISGWNVSGVTNFGRTFQGTPFNQPIGTWNTSGALDMNGMFYYATAFNQPLNSWNVSSVTNMMNMFNNASSFNRILSGWDVSSVTNMDRMFQNASVFDRDISGWCVTGIASEPADFDTGTPAGWTTSEKPNWGSCGTPVATCTHDGVTVNEGDTYTFYRSPRICGAGCFSKVYTCSTYWGGTRFEDGSGSALPGTWTSSCPTRTNAFDGSSCGGALSCSYDGVASGYDGTVRFHGTYSNLHLATTTTASFCRTLCSYNDAAGCVIRENFPGSYSCRMIGRENGNFIFTHDYYVHSDADVYTCGGASTQNL